MKSLYKLNSPRAALASCGPEWLPIWHIHRWRWIWSTLNDDYYICRCGTRAARRSRPHHAPVPPLDYDWLLSSNKG